MQKNRNLNCKNKRTNIHYLNFAKHLNQRILKSGSLNLLKSFDNESIFERLTLQKSHLV